jgi:hypothetical protein
MLGCLRSTGKTHSPEDPRSAPPNIPLRAVTGAARLRVHVTCIEHIVPHPFEHADSGLWEKTAAQELSSPHKTTPRDEDFRPDKPSQILLKLVPFTSDHIYSVNV